MKLYFILCSLSLLCCAVYAQPGSLDLRFDPGSGSDNKIHALALQDDGKIIIGGFFTAFNGNASYKGIARLNSDGSLDTSFQKYNSNTPGAVIVNALKIQPDGKILVGGSFVGLNGASVQNIARLNKDGTPDLGFNTGNGFNSSVYAIELQSDGEIIVGGSFGSYNGTPCAGIARLNSFGTLDNTFNPSTGFALNGARPYVYTLARQPDGNILVGGDFNTYKGLSCNFITRLNTTGDIDAAFNPGTGFDGALKSIIVQPDGKIIVGGYFLKYNGNPVSQVTRLNSNGSLDASFNPNGKGIVGASTFSGVDALALHANGSIIAGGRFGAYNQVAYAYLVRLTADGVPDTSFNTGDGFDFDVKSLLIQPNGKIVAGGWFYTFNGTARNSIARLNGYEFIHTLTDSLNIFCSHPNIEVKFHVEGSIYPGNTFTAQLSDVTGDFSTPLNIGSITGIGDGIIPCTVPANISSGSSYRIRVVSDNLPIVGQDNGMDVSIHNIEPVEINVNGFELGTTHSYESYQWFLNDIIIDHAVESTYTVKVNGAYSVVVNDQYGCMDTSKSYNITNVEEVGINEFGKDTKVTVHIFPNPVRDVLHVAAIMPLQLSLSDVFGRQMKAVTSANSIAVHELPAGIYWLSVFDRSGKLIKTQKIIKSND